MDTLFFILAFLSLILIPVSLIKPKLIKLKTRPQALVVTAGATLLFLVLFLATAPETEKDTAAPEDVVASADSEEKDDEIEPEPAEEIEETGTEVEETVEEKEDDISREHRNALKAAQNYIDMMPFSEKGLFEQLTSEYGDQYPEESAQYAIENVNVDYNEEALEAAENYQEIIPMSDQELIEQLTSEHGDQYTKEQAQYAIDNLPN